LVATDLRLLLIDKRTFFMTVEDIRYDMVSEINYSNKFYDATIHMFTLNKQHDFTTIKYKKQLRELTVYVQQRVWQVRQYQEQSNPVTQIAANTQPSAGPSVQATSPPLANTTISNIPHIPNSLHMPHLNRPQKPHLPRHLGLAAMSGSSRHYTPNAYTNHLTRQSAFMPDPLDA
jgi:hypothetical protein